MDIKYKDNNLIVKKLRDFNLTHIFDCGQCFRFNKIDENTYFGVAGEHPLKISQSGNEIILYDTTEKDFCDIWYDYFDLGRDYGEIKKRLSKDPVMEKAISYGDGIRILNQDLWETVISFIISASNNIPRIKGIVERFCENFGDKLSYGGKSCYSFPRICKTAALTKKDLSVIRAGFRDKYIMDAAARFESGNLSYEYLQSLSTSDAKKALMSIAGVGNKVSDCILLFGLSRADSFPVDVWIKRIMEYCYFNGEEQSIDTVSRFADKKFGDIGGFAQQYLFFYARENKISV